MITEWQPVMPEDKLKLKSRTLYEFLREDHSTFIGVGQGTDKEVNCEELMAKEQVVAWREYETKPLPSFIRTDAEVAAMREQRSKSK